jgi:hypothetical protein
VRFDDSLRTVLAADTTSAFGAQSAFRQLVDLIGRRRVDSLEQPIDRLRRLRAQVPAPVRAASARALTLGDPPAELVSFFAEDDPAIAAPVLRVAMLQEDEWLALLPRIGPTGRALLRSRSDLPEAVVRGLAAFGATDFTIAHDAPAHEPEPIVQPVAPERPVPDEPAHAGQTFAIAELVERIETFQRVREHADPPKDVASDRFAFETDARGVICWVDGIRRAGLVGRTLPPLASPAPRPLVTTTIHLDAPGTVGGEWVISATALFAPDTGRAAGYRGIARRAAPVAERPPIEPEALRRLVHELRTPTNAIAGFAELIATGMFGPAPEVHRARATAIGRDVEALLGAIDDLEISARIDGHALDLSPHPIELDAALAVAVGRAAGGDRLRLPPSSGIRVVADDRALDRLLVRLSETAAAGTSSGDAAEITVRAERHGVAINWPWRWRSESGSLLGVDFALRLAQRLATTLGGMLVIQPDRLTLHLPASFNEDVQATTY